jgi:hypothetical protein
VERATDCDYITCGSEIVSSHKSGCGKWEWADFGLSPGSSEIIRRQPGTNTENARSLSGLPRRESKGVSKRSSVDQSGQFPMLILISARWYEKPAIL